MSLRETFIELEVKAANTHREIVLQRTPSFNLITGLPIYISGRRPLKKEN